MRVVMKGVHCNLTDRLKEHIQSHLVTPMERFFDSEAAMMEVHLVDNNGPKRGLDKEARVTLHIPGLPSIHINEAAEDHYKALDLLRDRMETALNSEKERRRDLHRQPRPEVGQGSGLP